MGDASETNIPGSDAQLPDPVAVGLSKYPPGTAASAMPSSQFHQQQMYGATQNAFSSQFALAQARGSNPYNLSAMANALPQGGYPPPYLQGGSPQPRYNPAMAMPQPHQYPVHGIPMPNQQYYLQQHPGVPQYYPVSVSPSSHNPQARQNAGYYQGQLPNHGVGGSGNAPYYYPMAGSYSPANPQAMPAQYGHPPRQGDIRVPLHGEATDGVPLSPGYQSRMNRNTPDGELQANTKAAESMDGRQSGVRGPPRKPRQSGE